MTTLKDNVKDAYEAVKETAEDLTHKAADALHLTSDKTKEGGRGCQRESRRYQRSRYRRG